MRWLGLTMNIDLKELEKEISLLSEEEVREAVLATAKQRLAEKGKPSEAQKERLRHDRELVKFIMEKMQAGELPQEFGEKTGEDPDDVPF